MQKIGNIVNSQQIYAVLIAALLVCLPLPYAFSTGVLIVLLAVSLFSLKFHRWEFKKEYLLPILLYGLVCLSLVWSDDIKASSRGLERQMALVLIPLTFVFMPVLLEETRDTIWYWFSLAMALFAFLFEGMALLDYWNSGEPGRFFYHTLVAPLDLNAIYVSVFVSLSIVFLLFKRRKTPMVLIALVLLGSFLVLLSSKIIIVGTALLVLFGIFRTFKRSTILKLAPILVLGLGLLVFTNNPVKKRFETELVASNVKEVMESKKFGKVYYWTGTTIRLFQGRIFSEMLEEDKIFFTGYGINNSQKEITRKHLEYDLYKGFHNYNFHNQYLQAFAELGIFGLLLVLLLLGAILRQYLLRKDILFLSLFVIMLVVFSTESYLWRQRGLYHFLVLYCLLFKSLPNDGNAITNEP